MQLPAQPRYTHNECERSSPKNTAMFFRREKPKVLQFDDHVRNLEEAGFTVKRSGETARVTRGFCGASVKMNAEGKPQVVRAGVLIGDEIGVLVSRGYQMTIETESGKKAAALAAQLKALHAFQEDLREALGLTSLYNQGLGTVSARHEYDRVEERDVPHPARPWEAKKTAGA